MAALGVDGVRAAISHVVLRPVYQGPEGSLLQRAGARLWQHAQRQAWRCAELAADAGVDPFEGHLAGLLHGTGWTLLLRTLDGARPAGAPRFTPAFAERAADLATRLYAGVLAEWRLAPALDALAGALQAEAAGQPGHPAAPLAAALRRSQRHATAELAAQGPSPAAAPAPADRAGHRGA